MIKSAESKGILVLKEHNEAEEIDFELDYLLSLSLKERYRLMLNKSLEMKKLLIQHGHGKTPGIFKRQ